MNTGLQSADHEQGVIRAFVQQDKQERFLGFLANPKNRKKFTESLAHFRWFDQDLRLPYSGKWTRNSSFGTGTFRGSKAFIVC